MSDIFEVKDDSANYDNPIHEKKVPAKKQKTTLTDTDAGQLRSELLALIVPFPSNPKQLGANTLKANALIKGLPDKEVRKITNGDNGSFIKAIV